MRRGDALLVAGALIGTLAALPQPTRAASAGPIDRLDGIAPALARCWRAPHEGDEGTISVAFRRDGTLLGKPRITHMRASGGADGEAALANSLLEAVSACTPLRFTPSMGGSIAGRVLLIRLIAPRREQRAGQGDPSGERA